MRISSQKVRVEASAAPYFISTADCIDDPLFALRNLDWSSGVIMAWT